MDESNLPEPQVEVKYVWLDENGGVVSPRHQKFGTALAFVQGWHARWAKFMERWGSWGGMPMHIADGMTKTGNPPVFLTRLVVTQEYKPLDEAERITLQAFWQTSAGIDG